MKITDQLLEEMKEKDSNFSDGIILPDGDYRLIEKGGHLAAMIGLLPYTEAEVFKMVPEGDSPLFWLVERTGCVLTDYNSTIGMAMTPAQRETFDAMVRHGIIGGDYFDLTKQRQKIHAQQKS